MVRCAKNTRNVLHEAGEEAARRAIWKVSRTTSRKKTSGCITIEKDSKGKPYGILDGAPVAISISHSFPFAIGTASMKPNVFLGADIERIRDFAQNTWEAFLAPAEKELIASASPQERPYLRTLCWSLKESVLKARGTGLRMHPQKVDVSKIIARKSGSTVSLEIQGIHYDIRCYFWSIEPNFIATTATLSTSPEDHGTLATHFQ